MTNLRKDIKQLLKTIKEEMTNKTYTEVKKMNIDYLGIRNHYEEMEVGEEFPTSYEWNFEKDNSTYFDEEQEEVDTCAIIVATDEGNSTMEYWYDVELDLIVDNIVKKLDYTSGMYSIGTETNKYYLIAGSSMECRHSLDDDYEGRFENATMLMDLTEYVK